MTEQFASITHIEYFLPENLLTNDKLVEMFPEWTTAKIEKKIGIQVRHLAKETESSLGLGEQATKKLLNKEPSLVNKIDTLIFCTQSPEYLFPANACLLQNKLNLPQTIMAFDYTHGCSGFIYGLSLARSLIISGQSQCVLLVTAETYSKYIQPHDKQTLALFGDAAAATIIEPSNTEDISSCLYHTDGGKYQYFLAYNDLNFAKYNCENHIETNKIYMNGPAIFQYTLDVIPELVNSLLNNHHLNINQIDYFIFHQANGFMLENLRKKMNIEPKKFIINFSDCGNTVSSSIPIALKRASENQTIKAGDLLLLAGFGVGLSSGVCLLKATNF